MGNIIINGVLAFDDSLVYTQYRSFLNMALNDLFVWCIVYPIRMRFRNGE